jgi:hypothetical protein
MNPRYVDQLEQCIGQGSPRLNGSAHAHSETEDEYQAGTPVFFRGKANWQGGAPVGWYPPTQTMEKLWFNMI